MRNRVQTIQQTSKTFKGVMLLGASLTTGGILMALFLHEPGAAGLGVFCAVAGVGTYIVGRVLAWWNHG